MKIDSVKIKGDGYLVNGVSFVPKADGNIEYEEVKKWLSKNTPDPEFTQEELNEINKAELLAKLKVTTSKGNTFDAYPQARQDMADAILASSTLGVTETVWRMADNSEVLITLDELKEAHALAIQEYARIKGIGV